MGREIARGGGEDPGRRALEAIANTDNGVDRRLDLKRTETSLEISWPEKRVKITRTVDTASIGPSGAAGTNRGYTCGNCGGSNHNRRTCPN